MIHSDSNSESRRNILITGATSGLGRQTAVLLGTSGWNVIVHGRREQAVAELVAEIRAMGKGNAQPFVADLADLETLVKALHDHQLSPLDAMMLNAGMSSFSESKSAQGYELTFAVNVLAHQRLILELAHKVVEGGRIVVLSSGVHHPENKLARRAGIPVPRWEGVMKLARPDQAPEEAQFKDGRLRYSTSKLGNILQARGLQKRLRTLGKNVDVFALDPGLMVDTDLARELPIVMRIIARAIGRIATPFVDNMRLSRDTALCLKSVFEDALWSGKGFAYLDGTNITSPSDDALNNQYVDEFWIDSAKLLGMSIRDSPIAR